jgi:hypothetical protein
MPREVVNEKSTFTVRARFYGANNAPQAPATLRYRLRDISNDRIVIDWTELSTGTYVDIQVSAEANAIYDDTLKSFKNFEERVLVIQTDYETPDQCADEFRYVVRNLKGFDS